MNSFSIARKFISTYMSAVLKAHPVCQCMVYAFIMIVTMSLGTTLTRIATYIKPLENAQLDIQLGLNPLYMKNTEIVGITDYDYQAEFGSQSPLAPNKVSELIALIGKANPKLIVVDLDTSDPRFKQMAVPKVSCPIVWGGTATDEEVVPYSKHFGTVDEAKAAKAAAPVYILANVLGQPVPTPGIVTGVAQFPIDADGVVRNYFRRFSVRNSDGHVTAGSLPYIAAITTNPALMGKSTKALSVPLLFVSSANLLNRISCADMRMIADKPAWQKLAQGKVVVLGGYYQAARDNFTTPAGEMAGVELVAQAIDGELQKRMKIDIPQWQTIICQVTAGMFLAFLNCRFPGAIVACGGFLLIPIISLVAGAMLLKTCSVWPDLMPVLIAIQGQGFWNHVKMYQKMDVELKKIKADKDAKKAKGGKDDKGGKDEKGDKGDKGGKGKKHKDEAADKADQAGDEKHDAIADASSAGKTADAIAEASSAGKSADAVPEVSSAGKTADASTVTDGKTEAPQVTTDAKADQDHAENADHDHADDAAKAEKKAKKAAKAAKEAAEAAKPAEPESAKPAEPESAKPAEPESAKPAEPEPAKPAEP